MSLLSLYYANVTIRADTYSLQKYMFRPASIMFPTYVENVVIDHLSLATSPSGSAPSKSRPTVHVCNVESLVTCMETVITMHIIAV